MGTLRHLIKGNADPADLAGVTVTAAELNQFDASASDGAALAFADTQLTASQVNNLLGTNIELVAAPAAGLAVFPVAVHLFLDHGGTDFVQAAASDHLAIRYSASNEIAELGSEAQCTALIEATGDAALYVPVTAAFVPEAATALDLDNNGASEYATGDGTLSVRVFYRVVQIAAFS